MVNNPGHILPCENSSRQKWCPESEAGLLDNCRAHSCRAIMLRLMVQVLKQWPDSLLHLQVVQCCQHIPMLWSDTVDAYY